MSNPLKIYTSTSFVGDLSYQAPASQVAGLAHTFVTGRKTWKTCKGKNEAVWPAHIEAALFDALEKYRPASSVTGKVRTPKQVGSRLQQLRDTCEEEKVLKLLSRREFPPLHVKKTDLSPARSQSPPSPGPVPALSSSTSTTPVSSPITSEFPDLFCRGLSLSSPVAETFPDRPVTDAGPPTVVVDIFSSSASVPYPGSKPSHSLQDGYLAAFTLPTDGIYPTLTPEQRHVRLARSGLLSSIPLSVKILCPTSLPRAVRSVFYVFFHDELLYHESTDLERLPGLDASGHVQYATKLVPSYWPKLLQTRDLSHYTITHEIMKFGAIDAGQTAQHNVLFNISYKLNCVDPSQYFPSIELHVPGVPQLGPGVPIYAPRPLLFDTANTLLSVPANQCNQTWNDSRGVSESVTLETSQGAPCRTSPRLSLTLTTTGEYTTNTQPIP
ncbi:putative TEA/ATTS domain family protein [Lyophyllum shimeji]|uniref:TEA/ATTS domain family protein n=1 Tax=Lyophyllum shimeji TaxID=47721 RepID=A0A9P3PX42_LYOSH|nr:putative TEA/ATTS domain family protein [Lyophyllum shimeji]